MSSVALRKDPKTGIYFLDYYWQGKRYRPSCGTHAKKLAELKQAEAELRLFKGEMGVAPQKSERTPIGSLFQRYLELSEKTKAPLTYKVESGCLKAWNRYFISKGIVYADQITPAILSEFQAQSHLSHRSQNNYITTLKTVLNRAVDWDLLVKNPVAKFKRLKIAKKMQAFSDEEINKLLELAEPELKLVILLGAYAGLRAGEMRSLRWRDIDLKKKILTVRSDDEFTPKGKRGRAIPMHEYLLAALKNAAGKPQPDALIFPGFNGSVKRRGEDWASSNFRKLCRQNGIKGRLHDLRHTFGSRLVRSGVPLPVVRDLMGHADIQSTMIYVHVYPEQYRDAIAQL